MELPGKDPAYTEVKVPLWREFVCRVVRPIRELRWMHARERNLRKALLQEHASEVERSASGIVALDGSWEQARRLKAALVDSLLTRVSLALVSFLLIGLVVLALTDGETRCVADVKVRSVSFYTGQPLDLIRSQDQSRIEVAYRTRIRATLGSDWGTQGAALRDLSVTCPEGTPMYCTDLHIPAGSVVRLTNRGERQFALDIQENASGHDSLTMTWIVEGCEMMADGLPGMAGSTLDLYGDGRSRHQLLLNIPTVHVQGVPFDMVTFDRLIQGQTMATSIIAGTVEFPEVGGDVLVLSERDTLAIRPNGHGHLSLRADSAGLSARVECSTSSVLAGSRWMDPARLERIPSWMSVLEQRVPTELWTTLYGLLIGLWSFLFLRARK